MFGRDPILPVDVAFGIIKTSSQKSLTKYIEEVAERSRTKQVKYYDLKVRGVYRK